MEAFNVQTKSAYTPVKKTLKQLSHFMSRYQDRVLEDSQLVLHARAEQHREAAFYGATQAALGIQSELIKGGHYDAAVHIADLLSHHGLTTIFTPPYALPVLS